VASFFSHPSRSAAHLLRRNPLAALLVSACPEAAVEIPRAEMAGILAGAYSAAERPLEVAVETLHRSPAALVEGIGYLGVPMAAAAAIGHQTS